MAQGKVRSALIYLSHNDNSGILSLDDKIPSTNGLTTRDVLRDKHPTDHPACPESLIARSTESVNPIVYCNLDSACILMQPYIPMVRVTSLVLMPLLGEDFVPLSSLLLKTFALLLPLLVIEFVPVI